MKNEKITYIYLMNREWIVNFIFEDLLFMVLFFLLK